MFMHTFSRIRGSSHARSVSGNCPCIYYHCQSKFYS